MPLAPGELEDIEEQAVFLAGSVGRLLLERFRGPLTVEYKGKLEGQDPVTEADRAAEVFLKQELGRRFPGHAMVGEEGAGTGDEAAPLTWLVDPLDGTTNYLNGLPIFACSIALLEEGTPVVAAVYIPWPGADGGRVLHARAGGGAWVSETPLRVAAEQQPQPGRVSVLSGVYGGRFKLLDSLRRTPGERRSVGSTAYELALVADGTYQYALHGSPQSWDVAAGVLLVQEAGGEVRRRYRGRRGWHPFTTFGDPSSEAPPGQPELREWSAPVLAGNTEIVEFVAGRVVDDRSIGPRVRRALGRAFPRAASPDRRTRR